MRPTIPYYYVWYGWELADAVEDLKEYNISYDLKLPTDDIPENSMSLYPVLSAGSVDAADSNGSLTAVNDYVTKLGATVYSNQNYTVSDFNSVHDGAKYTDFLVFNYKNNSDYYTFDGWTVKGKDNTVYPIGKELTPDDMANLVDENNNITFVGKWTKIEPMTNEELQKALANLTLNALVGVDSQPLITQSVNGEPVTNDVELKEDDIISYTVQARLGSDIIGSSDGNGMTVQKDFAQFTYQVKVDSNLEFTNLNDDGTVILTFTAQKFEPTKTNIEGATISGGPGNWTITIDPENVPEEDGSLYIEVTMESMESSLSDINEPIVLSGLDFKLKASAVNDDVTLSTSANVVGSIDLHKKTQLRGYYQTVNFFMSYPDWKNYFNAGQDTPTAVAHASQFIDSKLTKIDLANDNMGLKANTCKATFVKPTYGIRVFVYDKATEKEDGSATGLANAAFALYKAEDVALAPDGSVMINQGATALKSGTTGADGYMTLGDLDEGTYYLFETQAPAGYAKNAQPWKITLPTDADTQTNMADVKIAYTLIPQTTEPDDDKPGEHQPSSTNGSGSVSDSTSGNTSGSTQNTETTQTQTTGSTAAAAAAASAIPQTSDESNPVLWTVLFLASGMTLAGITLCRRKTARHRS